MSIQLIHAALVALPAFAAEPVPETPEARAVRLEPVASVIWAAAEERPAGYSRQSWSGVIAAVAWHETRLARYVQAGRCQDGPKGMRCDNLKARSLWQLWRAACRPLWATEPGSNDALREGARCASRQLRYALHRCRSRAPTPLQGAFSGYAGASCTQPWAAKRERTAWRLASQFGG